MSAGARRLPAEEGLWAFVIADMTVFAIFFNVFAYYRAREPDIFHSGQTTLDTSLGLANTLILLTSSLFIVLALGAVRQHDRAKVVTRLTIALLCGVTFGALKIVEYSEKVSAGYTPVSNDFYMLYFVFTGIHLLHLTIGAVAVLAIIGLARRTDWNEGHVRYFESVAIYWHMVDLLWVILFSLIYLVR